MRTFPTKLLAIASACALGLVACKGDTGPAGAIGATGPTGATGANGISTGTVSGRVTNATTGNPIANATVATSPDEGTATTDANGNYSLVLPIGTYTLTFSGTGITTTTKTVSVVAGSTTTVNLGAPYSPIILVAPVATAPAGFGASAQLNVTVSGGTAPYTFAWTAKAANPTAVTLSNAAIQNPTFTTGTLKDVLASGKVVGIGTVRTVPGFLAISAQQVAQMTYNFTVKVTDAQSYTQTTTVSVPPATLAQGNGIVPLNQIVVLNVPGNASALDFTAKPGGSAATLQEADQVNPWFIPDAAGAYTVAGLTVNAGDFRSASSTCGVCHGGAIKTNVDGKFKEWANSAHGNHFFKYMEYDAGGALVWKTDASGNPLPAPTGDAAIFWTEPGAMTTFEFGMTGGEGSHYGKNCLGCHTTGYNLLASNGGADDAMTAAGWSFPDLKAAFGGDAVTPAPNFTVWDAIPASVKAYAGMQCESCHGPLTPHTDSPTTVKPVAEYDTAACAVCHDKPSGHDRVYLWRQSMHADLALAEEEAVVESRGTSTSCYRCHAAQGFVTYVAQQQAGNPGNIARPAGLLPAPATCTPTPQPGGDYDPACPCKPTPPATTCTGDPAFYAYLSGLGLNRAQVQPQTCAACHDPHATEIRVDGNTGPLANGWQMQGAGAGALCMVCHNTRNGARGDYVAIPGSGIGGPHAPVQADLYFGQNAYFMGAGGQVSKHAAVQETCVGCHMLLHPTSVSVRNTNHTFTADGTICSACHSSGVGLDALAGQFLVNRGRLETALASAFTAKVGGASPNYYVLVLDPGGSGAYANVNLTTAPTNIVPSGRQQNLTMTFATGVSDGWGNTVTTLTVNYRKVSLDGAVDGTGAAYTSPIFSTSGIIAKSNWNYWLVSSVTANPAANVIHNPSFVWDVLANTTSALLAAAAAGGAGL